jgi:hypothetical protein
MYFQPAASPPQAAGGAGALAAAIACAALVVGIGIFPRPVLNSAIAAEETLKSRSPVLSGPAAGVLQR